MNLDTLSYEQYYGLQLNIHRVHGRAAFAVFQGVGFAFSDGKIPPKFFEPICNSAEEAEDIAFSVSAQRAFANAVAGKKR